MIETQAPVQPATYVTDDELVVTITLADIKEGRQGESSFCAVAMALRHAGLGIPLVFPEEVSVNGEEYAAPEELAQWISAFDKGEPVTPERFRLERIWNSPAD